MKKIVSSFLLLCGILLAAAPQGFKFSEKDIKALGLKFEPVTIRISGLKKTYRFLWLSDLHVMAKDLSEIKPQSVKAMTYRRDRRFNNPQSKLPPAAVWKKLPPLLNASGADAVFFGGDICDTGSAANLALLADGFKQLKVPFIFLREDHDYSPWHLNTRDISKQQKISRAIDGHPAIAVKEYEDLMLVGIDRSVYRITPQVLKQFKALCAKGKPIILLIHVPLCTADTPELAKRSAWGGKKTPRGATKEFMKVVLAENSPVKAVFSGHLHGRGWQGKLTPQLPQYVFRAAFEGFIGAVTVTPDMSR